MPFFLAPDPIQVLSKPRHFPCIHHCSPFTFIMHNHTSLLYRHCSCIQLSLHTVHIFLTPLTSDPSPFCPMSKPPQYSLLCLTNQLSPNTCSHLHLISHSVYTHYSTHILLRHLISIIFNLFFSVTDILYHNTLHLIGSMDHTRYIGTTSTSKGRQVQVIIHAFNTDSALSCIFLFHSTHSSHHRICGLPLNLTLPTSAPIIFIN